MFDVITIGSATIDIFAYTDRNRFLRVHDEKKNRDSYYISYPAGEKILLKKIDFTVGGGGTNAAVSFSRLGFRTAYVGNIGKDAESEKVLDDLRKEKVSFMGTRGDEKTDSSVILDAVRHDRTILVYKEASECLDYSKIAKKNLGARWFYFSSLVGKSFRAMERLAEFAEKKNIKMALNPSSYQASMGVNRLKRVLDCLNVLVMNKEEAQLLLKKKTDDIPVLLKALKKTGKRIEIVLITDGKNGAYSFDGKTGYHVAAKKVRVIETTGAGDAFASTFIAGKILGLDVVQCLRMAMINSESVITQHGAKNKLLARKEILAALKKDNRAVKRIF